MRCPVCKADTLQATTLEEELPARRCATCAGTWIGSTEYQEWLGRHGANLPERPAAPDLPVAADTKGAKLCPGCGHIMGRYRVGHDVNFVLDHCGACQGVWLDGSEWEILVKRNLHDDLHLMFTAGWQRAVRDSDHRRSMEAVYAQRFGAADYTELRRVRAWLERHPHRSALLAYLNDPDPYGLQG